MPKIDERIRDIDKTICQNIDLIDFETVSRALVSQNLLSQSRNLVEHVAVKAYADAKGEDLEADWETMCKKDSLINNRNDLFMSFNYTDTLEKVYGIKDVLHLHGGIPSCCEIAPIMGHGNKYIIDSYRRKAKEAQEEYVEWYESICNAIADFCESLYKDTDAIINENDDFFSALWDVNQVVCLGLSFGDVDVPYLDRIEYEVRPETKWLVYYHSDEDLKRLKSVFGITGISRKFEVYFRKSDNFWDR